MILPFILLLTWIKIQFNIVYQRHLSHPYHTKIPYSSKSLQQISFANLQEQMCFILLDIKLKERWLREKRKASQPTVIAMTAQQTWQLVSHFATFWPETTLLGVYIMSSTHFFCTRVPVDIPSYFIGESSRSLPPWWRISRLSYFLKDGGTSLSENKRMKTDIIRELASFEKPLWGPGR